MSIFADALKRSTSRANRIHNLSSPTSFVTLSSLSSSSLRAPLSSPRSLREEYPSNILNGPRLKPVPLPVLSDEETEETHPSWSSPVHQKGRGYQSTPPPSPLSPSRHSLRSESPLSWHADMGGITESPSPPFYAYHYELPSSYTPPTPPQPTAHLVHAPVTQYKQLPH